eukprot:264916-Alexandrium_andersonii.AAC.1
MGPPAGANGAWLLKRCPALAGKESWRVRIAGHSKVVEVSRLARSAPKAQSSTSTRCLLYTSDAADDM